MKTYDTFAFLIDYFKNETFRGAVQKLGKIVRMRWRAVMDKLLPYGHPSVPPN